MGDVTCFGGCCVEVEKWVDVLFEDIGLMREEEGRRESGSRYGAGRKENIEFE